MAELNSCPKCGTHLPENAPSGICPKCLMQAGFNSTGDSDDSAAAYAQTTPQPGSFIAPDAELLSPHFPQLELHELLGQGGMGAVYKARQTKLDRLVALKIIRPESADDSAFAERFNREARTLARLGHPNIVGVHDFGEVSVSEDESGENPKTLYYFLMEYVDGANLRQVMDRGVLRTDQSLSIVQQICDALQFAHDEGIIHRDIKPENILIDSRGRVKIADFGLAKLASPSERDFTLTQTHQVMGTPRYMAPEQMAGSRAVDHRADLYSLGVVFYEMLTGQTPAGIFDPPSKSVPLDLRIDAIVMKSLAQKPSDRFQNASEIRSSLQVISQDATGSILSQPESSSLPPARGFSTIFEREIGAAWNWVVHPEKAKSGSEKIDTASFPRLLITLLALLGGLTMFLPWAEIHIDQQTSVTQYEQGATLISAVEQSFPGTSLWCSIAAGVVFFLFFIVLILIPHRRSPGWIMTGIMTLCSLFALFFTLFYLVEYTWAGPVELPLEVRGPEAVSAREKNEKWGGDREIVSSEQNSSEVYRFKRKITLRDFEDQVQFREGFYASLGFSISLLLLSVISIRNAIMSREPKSQTSASWSGTPLASLRFQTSARGDIGSKIKFHFAGLGYELVDEQPGTWIFQRGTMMGGMMQTDIRSYPTRLSVHAIREEDDSHLVNCHWSVRMMGGWAGKKDIRILEDEGRELETLLAGPALQPIVWSEPDSSDEGEQSNETGAIEQEIEFIHEEVETAGHPSFTETPLDKVAIEDEVSGPAIAMSVVGFLMLVGHAITMGILAFDRYNDEIAPMMIPGMLIGLGMMAGGFHLRRMGSLAWAQLGIIAGFVPTGPGWLLSFPISLWACSILRKPEIANAFLAPVLQRRRFAGKRLAGVTLTQAERELIEIEQTLSGPALAMTTVGFLMIVGHATALAIIATSRYDAELWPMMIPGFLIGTGMMIGGFHLKQLRSRGWAQLGIIAGYIPGGPGWVLSFPICLWAHRLLLREKVRQAFLNNARRRMHPRAR